MTAEDPTVPLPPIGAATSRSLDRTFRLFSRLWRRVRRDVFIAPNDQFAALNGLRAVACFLVVCMHVAMFTGNLSMMPDGRDQLSWFYRCINGFWSGLDFFFVLSGFLIGRILMKSLVSTGSVEFPSFFLRRSMRVFPAYYLVLTLAVFWYTRLDLASAKFFLAQNDWHQMLRNSWRNYVYVMNYSFRAGDPNPMSWSWSLCVEEQFYILLPPLLALLYRVKGRTMRPAILLAVALLPLIGRALQYALYPDLFMQDGFYFRTHNRIDELLVGVLIAYFYVHHSAGFLAWAERFGTWTWVTGVALILSVWVFGGIQQRGLFAVVFQFPLVALGAGLLVVNGIYLKNGMTRVLAHSAWYPWARVSYGIYLIHPYVLFGLLELRSVFNEPNPLSPGRFLFLYASVMLGSGLMAMVMFVLLERPLIDWGTQLSRRMRKRALARLPSTQ